jgi:uncharacterized NAD-dependent epimerase/dehydratase family protein
MDASQSKPPARRMLVVTDGYLDLFAAKTAVGLLRYCPEEVVAVLDRQHAGRDLAQLVGAGTGVPIVASIKAALPYRPNQFVIGVALPGEQFPPAWRAMILDALDHGLDIVNGLHMRLQDDAEIASRAAQHSRRLWDVRHTPAVHRVGTGQAVHTRAQRILTVGSDCNVGKKITALELQRGLRQRGLSAEFLATGQTGVMIAGSGIIADRVISDFLAGAVEAAVLERGDADFLLIEGQGGLLHPGFSAVTLGLMHGALPDAMILCHVPTRTQMRHTDVAIPPLEDLIRLHEQLLAPLHPCKIVGIALNGFGVSDQQLDQTIKQCEQQTGLPTTDCIRRSIDTLLDALIQSAGRG